MVEEPIGEWRDPSPALSYEGGSSSSSDDDDDDESTSYEEEVVTPRS
jgi:hypothetical protein